MNCAPGSITAWSRKDCIRIEKNWSVILPPGSNPETVRVAREWARKHRMSKP